MKNPIAAILVGLALVCAPAAAQQPPQKPPHDHAAMEARGAQAMGFDQQKATHRFLMTAKGGVIEVTANDRLDTTTIGQIQTHLREAAAAFAAGDFEKPGFIHGQTPPGVSQMKKMKGKIHYEYKSLPEGGRIAIETGNFRAKDAIHQFLTFETQEHAAK